MMAKRRHSLMDLLYSAFLWFGSPFSSWGGGGSKKFPTLAELLCWGLFTTAFNAVSSPSESSI